MKKSLRELKDTLITCIILCVSFIICLIIHNVFRTEALIPTIFIFGVFLTSATTHRYIYGIISSLASVWLVNYAFTFPYFRVNFSISENLVSTVIMISISLITCTYTTNFKRSEAIKAESEKEKMRANLLSAVSHDLRTPLTGIYGASSALLDNNSNMSEEQKIRMLTGIKENAQWLSRLVDNLLSITRLDSGYIKIIKTPTALDELIDSVLVKLKKHYPLQKVDIHIPDELMMIPMDAILIEQVILNILENAVQHAIGMTKLEVSVYANADKAVFEIKDNGCGIAEEKLKTIFTGGYIGSNKSSDSTRNNAGIGLSVCATIIKAHGGEISAKKSKSGGSVFQFILDMEEDVNDEQ